MTEATITYNTDGVAQRQTIHGSRRAILSAVRSIADAAWVDSGSLSVEWSASH